MNLRQYRRPIRIASIACAFVGIITNLITVLVSNVTYRFHRPTVLAGCAFLPLVSCMIANHIVLHDKRIFKHGLHLFLVVLVDSCSTLGFLALLIANGVIVNRTGNGWVQVERIQMLVYNSMPWVLIGMCHTFLALEGFVNVFMSRYTRQREVRCAECQRNVSIGRGIDVTDESTEPLINAKYDEEVDGDIGA